MASLTNVSGGPQGELYDFLMQYGGGSVLQRVETLNTKFSSGVYAPIVYMMMNVPGDNLPGIEYSEVVTTPTSLDSTERSFTSAPYVFFANLVDFGQGNYTPVAG